MDDLVLTEAADNGARLGGRPARSAFAVNFRRRLLGSEQLEGVVQAVVFNQDCEPSEVRMYPVASAGQTRHRLPLLLEPGSEPFGRAMTRAAELCDRVGTALQERDGYGAIAVK